MSCKVENVAWRQRCRKQCECEAMGKVAAERAGMEISAEEMGLGAFRMATATNPFAVAAAKNSSTNPTLFRPPVVGHP